MSPQRSDFILSKQEKLKCKSLKNIESSREIKKKSTYLTADVPDGEANIFVLDSFDIEANGRNGCDNLAELELVQDGCLTGGVQADHQNSHLLLAEQTRKQT
jgi:hypothetical protein